MNNVKMFFFLCCLLLFPGNSAFAAARGDSDVSFLQGAEIRVVPNPGVSVSSSMAGSAGQTKKNVSSSLKKQAADRIYKSLSTYKKEVDLSDLNIPYSDDTAIDILDKALEYNLYLFNTLANYSDFSEESQFCACYTSGAYIDSFQFQYRASASTLKKNYKALQNKVTAVASSLKLAKKKPVQRVLAVHDYIALHAKYDSAKNPAQKSYTAYGALIKKKAVCSGYSNAAQLLLEQCGVSAKVATSDEMNHAWNLVLLDGSWYHMDITWDDPYPKKKHYVAYWFFLKTDKEFQNHPISPHSNWDSGGIRCTSGKYSRIPLTDNRYLSHKGNFWYYRPKKKNASGYYTYTKYTMNFLRPSTLASSVVPFVKYSQKLYYADPKSRIVSIDLTGKHKKILKTLPLSSRVVSLEIGKKQRLQYQYRNKKTKKKGSIGLQAS